jgi:hypothetical protein
MSSITHCADSIAYSPAAYHTKHYPQGNSTQHPYASHLLHPSPCPPYTAKLAHQNSVLQTVVSSPKIPPTNLNVVSPSLKHTNSSLPPPLASSVAPPASSLLGNASAPLSILLSNTPAPSSVTRRVKPAHWIARAEATVPMAMGDALAGVPEYKIAEDEVASLVRERVVHVVR